MSAIVRWQGAGWRECVASAHKFSLRAKISQALEGTDLDGEERKRLMEAKAMVQDQASFQSSGRTEERFGPTFLQAIGGLGTLMVLAVPLNVARTMR